MKGFITYTIQQGDTLQRIATQYQVDSWQQIAALNNLSYPFIDDSIEAVEWKEKNPNLRYIGDSILVPAKYDELPEAINTKELQKLAYGCDFDITTQIVDQYNTVNIENGGELREDEDGDLVVLEGVENLKQAFILRLMTPKGALPLHPDYGTDLLLLMGKSRTYKQLVKIKLEVERTIKEDFRVTKIDNLSVVSCEKGGIKAECDIIPIEPFSSFRFVHEFLLV